MNDKELLELAAKAAGVDSSFWCDGVFNEIWCTGFIIRDNNGNDVCWNPLTDDGDALRLAVSIGLSGLISLTQGETEVYPSLAGIVVEKHGDDPYAATRRAIVRAAAEIGKAMA